MPKFQIKYIFDGHGTVEIEGDTKEEAIDLFFQGEFKNERETGENYCLVSIDSYNPKNQ